MYNVTQLRQDYETVKKIAGKKVAAASSLFMTVDIVNDKTVYNFGILENQANVPQQPDEIRLAQTDTFIFNRMAVGFVADYGFADPGQPFAGFEDGKSLFIQSIPYSKDDAHQRLYKLWSGKMRVTIDNYIYYEKFDLRQFDNSTPFNQYNHNFAISDGPMTAPDTFLTGVHRTILEVPVQPMIVVNGGKKNDFEISIPTSITPTTMLLTDWRGTKLIALRFRRIGVLLRGFLIQGGAEFNPRKS